ncbi:hypothetical protein OV079_35475 [Nannocystis pusilla]|uniref:Uncharacterized protein n=1 Tax=Nannocystis pusilla TaxID=889268 RepID=A0A9X3F3J9_9BACT|nr:hypothetical protein [Nannocystis pusilla]MCY1010776.1 hypothetical protein [Nannocystis pusilla]
MARKYARAGRQRGRRHVVVLDEVAHQHVDRAHDVVAAREQVEDHVVGLGVTARAQVVELLVGPAEVAHAATVRAAAAACPRAKARARALDLPQETCGDVAPRLANDRPRSTWAG